MYAVGMLCIHTCIRWCYGDFVCLFVCLCVYLLLLSYHVAVLDVLDAPCRHTCCTPYRVQGIHVREGVCMSSGVDSVGAVRCSMYCSPYSTGCMSSVEVHGQ